MIAERVHAGLTRVQDEKNAWAGLRVASALENESVRPWRLPDGPLCAVNPGTVQRISRPFEQDAVAL